MDEYLDDCENFEEASVLLENFNFKSPQVTAKIESLPSTSCKLMDESDEEDIYEKEHSEKRPTPEFYYVNSIENGFDSFILEEIGEEEYLNEILSSSKSCEMNIQSDPIDEKNGFRATKSTEIESNKKSFEDESREDKVNRYKLKKPMRNFGKVIRYVCRKNVAVVRVRVAGRFQKETLPDVNASNVEENFANNSEKIPKAKVCKEKQISLKKVAKQRN